MKFLNKRTGGIVIVPCRLEGPDWEEITEAKAEPQKTEAKAPVKAEKKAPAKAATKAPARKRS